MMSFISQELVEENTIQKRYCGCDQQLCETAEEGK